MCLLAIGLGGPSLAHLCDAFAWNHKQLMGGLPDLLIWRVTAPGPAVAAATAHTFTSPYSAAVAAASPGPHASSPPSSSSYVPSCSTTGSALSDTTSAAPYPLHFLPPRAAVEVALVEVKGPRDTLSEKQHVWLRILLDAGVSARVCKITEAAAVAKKVAASAATARKKRTAAAAAAKTAAGGVGGGGGGKKKRGATVVKLSGKAPAANMKKPAGK